MPWKVVWEAIAIPDAPPATGAMAAVGLNGIKVGFKNDPTSVYHGFRHGRWVQIRQERTKRGQVMIVWIGVAAPIFSLVGDDGVLVAIDAPAAVTGLVDGLVEARVWNGLRCHGGAHGIVTRRMVSNRFPQGWMFDLWLAEAVAGVTAAPPLALRPGDPASWMVPEEPEAVRP